MGYFANGSEGMTYEEYWCRRCVHVGPEDGPGCAVWLAHLLYNYDQHKDENLAEVLNVLIPRDAGGQNQECAMFTPRDAGAAIAGQTSMETGL